MGVDFVVDLKTDFWGNPLVSFKFGDYFFSILRRMTPVSWNFPRNPDSIHERRKVPCKSTSHVELGKSYGFFDCFKRFSEVLSKKAGLFLSSTLDLPRS